ncbi:hypothetical protein G6F68_014651 [Rhizopus microsporus]|nr:hypothetical protein G6F68_014651 [Rhizopus microsporus]
MHWKIQLNSGLLKPDQQDGLPSHLRGLLGYYQHSSIAASLKDDIENTITNAQFQEGDELSINSITIYERPGPISQFQILANRTFKNLYRNPMLMFSHYAMAVILARKFTD